MAYVDPPPDASVPEWLQDKPGETDGEKLTLKNERTAYVGMLTGVKGKIIDVYMKLPELMRT